MTKSKGLFSDISNDAIGGVTYKALSLKKSIISYFSTKGDSTISELCSEFNTSTPTMTKIIGELMSEGYVLDFGKVETGGGRRPNIYGLDPKSAYFLGIEVRQYKVNLALFDIKENLCKLAVEDYDMENSQESLKKLCNIINKFIKSTGVSKDKIMGAGVNLSGRVNSETGYSYSFFNFQEEPLSNIIESRIGVRTFLENDTRAMAYGEYVAGCVNGQKNVLFLNIGRGIGVGLVINGELYYGNSGFAGEFGHIPFFENDIICRCGKKGCLETEVSGRAMERICAERLEKGNSSVLSKIYDEGRKVGSEDIINAACNEDVLAIEIVEQVGKKLGKGLAMLINIFNPELIVMGGSLSATGDYLMLPMKSSVNKFSLNLVYNDTKIEMSKLNENAGVIGAGLLVKKKLLKI